MGLRVRDMRPEDLDEVVRIIRLHDADDGRYAKHSLQAWFGPNGPAGDPCFQYIVAVSEEEDRVLGVSGFAPDLGEGEGVFWLGWTYVNPWTQGQGVGRQLLDEVLARLAVLGARKLFLETSTLSKYETAVAFYAHLGFREEGRLLDFYGPGEHKIMMGLPL